MVKARILVVEDDRIVAKDIQESLEIMGYAVLTTVPSGKEAIESAENNAPDLILMDIKLKGEMNGTEADEELHGRLEIPIIYLTAYSDDEVLEKAKITEPFGYLIKPFEDRELRSTIEIALYKHKIEKKLKENEEWLATTLKSIGDAVITTDTNGNVTFLNPAAESLTGWRREDAVGIPLKEMLNIVDEETRRPVENLAEKVIDKNKIDGIANATLLITKHGEEIPIDAGGSPIRNDRGEITGAVYILSDVSQRKQAEEEKAGLEAQLRQANKMEAIGTLAGGIAHDFNNMLSIILGYADLAKIDAPSESNLAEKMDKILQAGDRAKDLVKHILTFSRQARIEKRPIKPHLIIEEALQMLRSSIPATIEIQEDISRECGFIDADSSQLHQIIMNLCTNAFHAMEKKGGILRVCLKIADAVPLELIEGKSGAEDTFLELSIHDTGQGIDADIITKIFDPFFTTKEKGTGMGLSITYGIIKDHGGAITVDSQLGKGTAFHIYLPQCERAADFNIAEEVVVSGGRERILFVDDEELLLEMNKNILERLGYDVTAILSSCEALEVFRNKPNEFDLVVTDQTMPGMTGLDLAKRMLQIRPDTPIILATGHSTIVNENLAKAHGIKEFVLKPLTALSVAKLIRKVLQENQSDID